MYNIHSHYENIFCALKDIVTHRRLLYLLPYGSTQPEHIESLSDELGHIPGVIKDGPLFIFYDQEPILGEFNYPLLEHVTQYNGPHILVTTEKNSETLDAIKSKYNIKTAYYFHHAFAASDWFRGYRYCTSIVPPAERKLVKKYITFNRITSGLRVYRSLFISELCRRGILDQGYVSYNDTCSENGYNYVRNLADARDSKLITHDTFLEACGTICQAPLPLRIDYQDQEFIPNHSFVLSAIEHTQESFCYVVTETCYWERKYHLTEKVFKPIVSQMPFILVGPAHNLKYLREYGFKTFSPWIDESYDDIEDPIDRMHAISRALEQICDCSTKELENILKEMTPVLEHNYNLFYSNQFLDCCWNELINNLQGAAQEFQ